MTRRRGQVVDLRQTDRKELPARVTISFIAPLGSRARPKSDRKKFRPGQEGSIAVVLAVTGTLLSLSLSPSFSLIPPSPTIVTLFSYASLCSRVFHTRTRKDSAGKEWQKTVDRGRAREPLIQKISSRTCFRQAGCNKFSHAGYPVAKGRLLRGRWRGRKNFIKALPAKKSFFSGLHAREYQ